MLLRKMLRTALSYRSQFISMLIMVTLGVGIFLGFNMEWCTIEYDTSRFFSDTAYADYRLYSQEGFTKNDLAAISSIEGVDAATRFLSVNLDVEGETNKALAVDVSEDFNVSTFSLTEGEAYDPEGEGIWLSDKYAAANNISPGDTLALSFQDITISGEVVGLVKSGEHMICVADSTQLMPDYSTFGFAYISPAKLKSAVEEIMLSSYTDGLGKLGLNKNLAEGLAQNIIPDEMKEKALDRVYCQINLLSDMEKTKLEDAVKDALGRTIMVTSKDEHVVYQEAMGEASEGKTMGSVLPVLFLAIAILTMVTTMHRIATKEKQQIGILKALGFKNRRILLHYTSYGFFIGIIGTVFGVALGYWICKLVMSEDGMMGTYFDMPDWSAAMPGFCYPVIIGTIALLTLISFLSVHQQLRGCAADALRPYTPKKMKKSLIERTGAFDKMLFGTKWNLRDLSRHKSRLAMSLVGIVGCMILLVGGLGMRDTLTGFLDLMNSDISTFTTKVNLKENTDAARAKELAEELEGDWESLSGISLGGDTVMLDIVHNDKGLFGVIDEKNDRIDLSDEGVYLCLRLSDRAEIGEEIEFSPYGSDKTYTATVIGYNRSVMTESVTMTDALADELGIEYSPTAIYTDRAGSEIEKSDLITGRQDQTQLMESYDSFMLIMDSMVVILIIAAVILGIVVLYNLGIMSYVERTRELATLKVLGFRDRSIGKLLISQNIWLTVIGVIIGLPAGIGVLNWLLVALAGEYEMKLMLGPLTYVVSILLTFGTSLLVGWMVSRKSKKIDMVEALKIAE